MWEMGGMRCVVAGLAMVLIAGAVITWLFPASPGHAVEIPAELAGALASVEPEVASPLLTKIHDHLLREHPVRQVLLLQAVPDEPPIVVAAVEDSSDEEEATHWPSPWQAVNEVLKDGRLDEPATVRGRHAGFDYLHDLIPVDDTRSRILLINQAAPAPRWSLRRLLLIVAGVLLLVSLSANRS